MSDDNRVPLFVRIPPSLKTDVADRAWRERMSVSRLVEDALRERLSKGEVTREAV